MGISGVRKTVRRQCGLTQCVYEIGGFTVTATETRLPEAQTYEIDRKGQLALTVSRYQLFELIELLTCASAGRGNVDV